jgi:hypothetical protein
MSTFWALIILAIILFFAGLATVAKWLIIVAIVLVIAAVISNRRVP